MYNQKAARARMPGVFGVNGEVKFPSCPTSDAACVSARIAAAAPASSSSSDFLPVPVVYPPTCA